MPATYGDFDFFFSKYPRFSNLKLDFFPIEKLLHKTIFLANLSISELIMSEVSKDLRNIFFPKIPRIFELEVGFFSDRKTFAQNAFPGKFYYFETNYERSFKRFAEHFFSQNTPDFEN